MRVCYIFLIVLLNLIGGHVMAHQFTPTYPRFDQSIVEGVVYTKMELFNKRREVEYYELGVFTKDWEPVVFASEDKLIYVKYLEIKKINVYVKIQDLDKVTYICTESRLRKEDTKDTVISSKICSKVK
jgi:hypothetical protein